MEKIDVTALEIRDYAMSQGWKLVPDALREGLFVLNSPLKDYTQLVFPTNTQVSDYVGMATASLEKLAMTHRLSFHKVLEGIREVNDDVICLRYYSESKIVNSISFEEALESISAARQLLLSAASSVVSPLTYHPKLNRAEPQDLIKSVRFRHTEEGSFVLKISCPFEVVVFEDSYLPILTPQKPMSRRTFELINRSASKILDAIEAAQIKDLYQSELEAQDPIVSYNFCDALSRLYDEERELPYEVIFQWSKASISKFPLPQLPQRIHFPFSHKDKLEEVKTYFAPPRKDISATFIGTVEMLDGDIGKDGQRSGPVVLSLLYEGELIRARAILNATQYQTAIQVHAQGGSYIQVKGDLKRGKTRNTIENLSEFRLLEG